MSNTELLQLANSGDQAGLIAGLERKTRPTHGTCRPGQQLTESEKLRDEALWYARHGDLEEAAYRLAMVDDDQEDDDGED